MKRRGVSPCSRQYVCRYDKANASHDGHAQTRRFARFTAESPRLGSRFGAGVEPTQRGPRVSGFEDEAHLA